MFKYLIALVTLCSAAVLPAEARGHHGVGSGCYGVPVGYGCYGGWHVSYGCYGSMPISYSCYGGCYGGMPIAYSCYGGCYGSMPYSYGCYGSTPISVSIDNLPPGAVVIEDKPLPPQVKREERRPETKASAATTAAQPAKKVTPKADVAAAEKLGPPEAEAKEPAPATIVVRLPANAELRVNKNVSKLTSATRTFVSPPLNPGKDYYYTLEAAVTRDGQVVRNSVRVAVRAGEKKEVLLAIPEAAAAAR